MASLSHPEKPLRILTIDGGGHQAIASLMILEKLLQSLPVVKKTGQKPRPCDVFDIIAGIGAGGWLALFLGRFHMDIYSTTEMGEEMRRRVLRRCYLDPEGLQLYCGTDENLIAKTPDGVRNRHVFVAARRSDEKEYNLFRTYEIPKNAALPQKLLAGPKNPSTFKVWGAFAATCASKYFAPVWKEQMAGTSGKTSFSARFPKSLNITKLALDEMWGLYGYGVRLSVVVNIGPGLPNAFDVRKIPQRFSAGLIVPTFDSESPNTGSAPQESTANISESKSSAKARLIEAHIEAELKKSEASIEREVEGKLASVYEGGELLYFRLAPDQALKGTTRNDTWLFPCIGDQVDKYCEIPAVKIKMNAVVQKLVSDAT